MLFCHTKNLLKNKTKKQNKRLWKLSSLHICPKNYQTRMPRIVWGQYRKNYRRKYRGKSWKNVDSKANRFKNNKQASLTSYFSGSVVKNAQKDEEFQTSDKFSIKNSQASGLLKRPSRPSKQPGSSSNFPLPSKKLFSSFKLPLRQLQQPSTSALLPYGPLEPRFSI